MTTISYYINEHGFEIETVGHAGYAPKGTDIVCAAVSTLTQTLLYRIMDLTIMYDFSIKEGELYITAAGDVLEPFNTILTGLQVLEEEYPRHVQVYHKGCPIKQNPEKIIYSHKGRDLPQD